MVTIDCVCPPKAGGEPRHANDTITFRERLGFTETNTIRHALGVMYSEDPEAGIPEILAVLQERYVLLGIESWSLASDDGPIPVTKASIRRYLLDNQAAAETVADAADELYREQVMLPLFQRASTSSPPTSTDGSTSPLTGSPEPSLPTPFSPSSTTTTPTGDTATTGSPPAGDSSFSPSLVSVN